MRPAFLRIRALLPIALALGAAFFIRALTGRPAAPQPEPERPRTAPVPSTAQRHPLEPERGSAALAPAVDPAASDSWVELNNEATDDLARGELELAVAKLERCREAEPENPVFTGNLVESLVRLARLDHEAGRLASAIEHLEHAIELGRDRADLELLQRILERWRREQELGQDDWTEDSDRFELTYDTDRSDILHHSHEVLEHLELCYEDLVRWFGLDPLEGTRVRVVLYDPEDFDRLTGLGDWAAGVFDGVVRVSVRDLVGSSDWRYVLRHELVHAFVQALVGSAPPGWLNEGLAQWLENRPGEMQRLRVRLGVAPPFSLDELGGSLASWKDSEAIGRAYAESLVFTDWLATTYGEEALRRMLLGTRGEGTAARAFEEWTHVPLETAFEDWADSLAR